VSRRYGDLASFAVGKQRFFLVNHPDLVREAFVTNHESFVKGWGPQSGNTVVGRGLITSERELHRQQRRLLLPGFHRQRLEEYGEAVLRHGRGLRDRWAAAGDADVLAEVRSTTIRIIGETMFGRDDTAEVPALGAASQAIFRRFAGRMRAYAAPLRRLQFRSNQAGALARSDLYDFAAKVIAERKAAPGTDIVSMLLAARDEAGEPLPDVQLRDEIVTFYFAGHETVSLALVWAWSLLAHHPRAQALLDAELDAVLGGRDPSYDDLKRLTFTQAVIAESMRLYPPQWMIGRRAIEPVELGGCLIAEGETVLLCLSSLQRDGRWFTEPDAFRPERWSAGIEKTPLPFTYLPFGAGLRRCIGEGFAWMEATLLLATIASRFHVRSEALEPAAMLMLAPKGRPRMQLERRR
jgi:cytochrome P450